MSKPKNSPAFVLASAGVIVFSLAAIVLIFLKFRAETGPGLIAAGPCMAAASLCQTIRLWNTDRKRSIMMILCAVMMLAVGIYFAMIG